MSSPSIKLSRHRAHDSMYLIQEWFTFCSLRGFNIESISTSGQFPIIRVRTAREKTESGPVIYISTGVHGDEVAPPWGLLLWAKRHWRLLSKHHFVLFPLLNPEGIALNTRADAAGLDLNREFHNEALPTVAAWKKEVADDRYDLCLCLHEDYDGQGCYLYEFAPKGFGIGAKLLSSTESILPIDRRRDIDGHFARKGWIYPKGIPQLVGEPEAIALVKQGCPRVITFETPSEYSLELRVEAQQKFIKTSVDHVLKERRSGGFLK